MNLVLCWWKWMVYLMRWLHKKKIQEPIKVKNYDINVGKNMSESETLAFFYEDIWNLKNKILLLIAMESNNN